MKVPLQIRFGDIDRLGHVNNAVHAQFFDIGRVKYLYNCLPNMGFSGKTLVLVHLETDFKKPIFEKDEIYVETLMGKVGDRSVTMIQYIKDKENIVRSQCKSVLSTLDTEGSCSFPIPEEWREKLLSKI